MNDLESRYTIEDVERICQPRHTRFLRFRKTLTELGKFLSWFFGSIATLIFFLFRFLLWTVPIAVGTLMVCSQSSEFSVVNNMLLYGIFVVLVIIAFKYFQSKIK